MKHNPYAAFYAAYNASVAAGNPLSKEELVLDFTQGSTSSLKELSSAELDGLVARLNQLNRSGQAPYKPHSDKADSMRKSIIALFYKMNKTPAQAKAWAEKQGVRGVKKKFNHYTNGELFTLIRIAEKICSEWQSGIRKRLNEI